MYGKSSPAARGACGRSRKPPEPHPDGTSPLLVTSLASEMSSGHRGSLPAAAAGFREATERDGDHWDAAGVLPDGSGDGLLRPRKAPIWMGGHRSGWRGLALRWARLPSGRERDPTRLATAPTWTGKLPAGRRSLPSEWERSHPDRNGAYPEQDGPHPDRKRYFTQAIGGSGGLDRCGPRPDRPPLLICYNSNRSSGQCGSRSSSGSLIPRRRVCL